MYGNRKSRTELTHKDEVERRVSSWCRTNPGVEEDLTRDSRSLAIIVGVRGG